MNSIDLSVIIVSYNQEKIITEAINSVLMQDVSFSYEIIFADDASTDNTQQIIREACKSMDNVQYLFREENIGLSRNVVDAISKCRGRYIAYLEGDDYWYDKEKLKRQYDFLESHQDYVATAGLRALLGPDNTVLTVYPKWTKGDCDVTIDSFFNADDFSISEVVFRNIYQQHLTGPEVSELLFTHRQVMLDVTFPLILLHLGKVRHMQFISGVYRTDIMGNTSNYNASTSIFRKAANNIIVNNQADIYFDNRYDFSKLHAEHLFQCSVSSLLNKDLRIEFKDLKKMLKKEYISYYRRRYVLFFIKYAVLFIIKVYRKLVFSISFH